MRVLILGATGPTGVQLVQEALAAGHNITIYARSPHKLPEPFRVDPSITIIEGQLTDLDGINKAMAGAEAVLSVLGPPSDSGLSMSSYPFDAPIARAYAVIIEAMKRHHVKRLIALDTASFKDANDKFSFAYALLVGLVALLAKGAYKDVIAMGETIQAQGKNEDLEWTIARVPILTNNPKKDAVAGYIGDGQITITLSRASYARWVIQELETGQWKWKSPQISDRFTDFRALLPF